MISDNLNNVTQRIAKCCEKSHRPADSVKLICVTKEAGVSQIDEVLRSGIEDLGENRVQDLSFKYKTIGKPAVWHLVGHLQTNKVKEAVMIASLIHSVDSIKLAKTIDNQAVKIGKVQDMLAQVNISGEETKFGFSPEELPLFLKEVSLLRNINIIGLMTIAPEVDDQEEARPFFRALRELLDRMNTLAVTRNPLTELSMGMSNDFEIAIEEGSTMIRIGRAIFK